MSNPLNIEFECSYRGSGGHYSAYIDDIYNYDSTYVLITEVTPITPTSVYSFNLTSPAYNYRNYSKGARISYSYPSVPIPDWVYEENELVSKRRPILYALDPSYDSITPGREACSWVAHDDGTGTNSGYVELEQTGSSRYFTPTDTDFEVAFLQKQDYSKYTANNLPDVELNIIRDFEYGYIPANNLILNAGNNNIIGLIVNNRNPSGTSIIVNCNTVSGEGKINCEHVEFNVNSFGDNCSFNGSTLVEVKYPIDITLSSYLFQECTYLHYYIDSNDNRTTTFPIHDIKGRYHDSTSIGTFNNCVSIQEFEISSSISSFDIETNLDGFMFGIAVDPNHTHVLPESAYTEYDGDLYLTTRVITDIDTIKQLTLDYWIHFTSRYVIIKNYILYCAHMGKWIKINDNASATKFYRLAHEGQWKKIERCSSNNADHSPIYVVHKPEHGTPYIDCIKYN